MAESAKDLTKKRARTRQHDHLACRTFRHCLRCPFSVAIFVGHAQMLDSASEQSLKSPNQPFVSSLGVLWLAQRGLRVVKTACEQHLRPQSGLSWGCQGQAWAALSVAEGSWPGPFRGAQKQPWGCREWRAASERGASIGAVWTSDIVSLRGILQTILQQYCCVSIDN